MRKYISVMTPKTQIKCVCIIFLAFISSFLTSMWPVRLSNLYTNISGGMVGTITQGIMEIAFFGLIYLLAECITIIRRVLLDCIITTHEAEVRENSIEKLLKMPVAYYSQCPSGEKTAQLNQGVSGFSQLIKIICNDVCVTVFTAICILLQVFLNTPRIMVGIIVIYLALTMIISIFQIRSQNGIRERIVKKKNMLDGKICQSISNLELIRGMNAECFEKQQRQPDIFNISRIEKKHHIYMGTFDCIKQISKISFQTILLVVSVLLIFNGKMSSGAVITVCLLFQQLVKPVDEVYRFIDEIASSLIKTKVLIEMTDSASDEVFDIKSSGEDMTATPIHFKDVLVMNPEKDKLLAWYKNIVIPFGKNVALRGINGCGKTTLIRCLNRYYPYKQGSIILFGRRLETYSQKELSDILYYVPQNTFFFSGTIRDNLVYGLNENFTDEELINVLFKVRLVGNYRGVICENPQEVLEYIVSEKASELSGGMRQRLSLARAFLRKPKMYVFDEITANLDEYTTDIVLSNIEQHAQSNGASIVYISHDQKVVDRCDMVITVTNDIAKYTMKKEVA